MIKLVAYTTEVVGNEVLIRDSEGESVQSDNHLALLEFLNEPYSDRETFAIKVMWDLDTTLAPVLRKLGVNACRELASPTHTYKSLFYIPSKVFAIHGKESQSYFYHLAQYYVDEQEPPDAETIAAMAENVMDAFHQMGLNPKKLTSPIAIYDAEVLSHMKIPTIQNIPGEHEALLDYAEQCTGRLWIQAYQLGHWLAGEAFEYDIRGCYPNIASRLRSLQFAKYAKSPCIQPKADWGFIKGKVTIYDDVKVHPIFYDGEITNSQPTGTWETYITLYDYYFIRKWGIGEFIPEMGYYIFFTAPVMPMEVAIKRLFKQRGQGGLVNDIAKRVSTAMAYGKFLERHDDGKLGLYYNPPYAAMINSIANIQVCDFIYKHKLQDDLIHVGVDGIISNRYIDLPRQENVPMGGWRYTGTNSVLVISSGRVYHGEKKPGGLVYDQLVKLIEANPGSDYFSTTLKRRWTLEECLQNENLNQLGKLRDVGTSINLNFMRIQAGSDRYFPELPSTGQELLDNQYKSEPVKVGEKVVVG